MLGKVTRETFEPRQGEIFRLTDEEAGEVALELTEVRGTGLQGKAAREQFSLRFHGPREPLLPQRIYRLENAAAGAMDIFLVPIARDDGGATYEAIFT